MCSHPLPLRLQLLQNGVFLVYQHMVVSIYISSRPPGNLRGHLQLEEHTYLFAAALHSPATRSSARMVFGDIRRFQVGILCVDSQPTSRINTRSQRFCPLKS